MYLQGVGGILIPLGEGCIDMSCATMYVRTRCVCHHNQYMESFRHQHDPGSSAWLRPKCVQHSVAYITSTVAGDQLKPGNIAYIIVNNQSTNSAEVLTATLIAWVYRKHM